MELEFIWCGMDWNFIQIHGILPHSPPLPIADGWTCIQKMLADLAPPPMNELMHACNNLFEFPHQTKTRYIWDWFMLLLGMELIALDVDSGTIEFAI